MLYQPTIAYFPIWTPKVSPLIYEHVFVFSKDHKKEHLVFWFVPSSSSGEVRMIFGGVLT